MRKKNKPHRRNKRPSGSSSGSVAAHTESIGNAEPADNRRGSTINNKMGCDVESTEISENMKEVKEVQADRRIAIYIAVLAVFLAICTMGGDNATKDATRTNIQASDMWAHYQAKKLRETNYKLAIDNLELRLAAEPNAPEEARKQIQEKINAYRAEVEHLKSDPKKGEGQEELSAKAREIEVERDVALRRDPYFDYSTAFLQIAIVLASASIVFGGGGILMIGSLIIGAVGVGLMVNGFFLIFSIPFIG